MAFSSCGTQSLDGLVLASMISFVLSHLAGYKLKSLAQAKQSTATDELLLLQQQQQQKKQRQEAQQQQLGTVLSGAPGPDSTLWQYTLKADHGSLTKEVCGIISIIGAQPVPMPIVRCLPSKDVHIRISVTPKSQEWWTSIDAITPSEIQLKQRYLPPPAGLGMPVDWTQYDQAKLEAALGLLYNASSVLSNLAKAHLAQRGEPLGNVDFKGVVHAFCQCATMSRPEPEETDPTDPASSINVLVLPRLSQISVNLISVIHDVVAGSSAYDVKEALKAEISRVLEVAKKFSAHSVIGVTARRIEDHKIKLGVF
jgi:hypothetical protein